MSRFAVPVLTLLEAQMLERAAGLCHVREDLHANATEWAAFNRAMGKLNAEIGALELCRERRAARTNGGAR